MRIAVEGKHVVMLGADGDIGRAIASALAGCGAVIHIDAATGRWGNATEAASAASAYDTPYLLVNLSSGLADAEAEADELERFTCATRALAPSVRRVINVISAAGLVPLRGAAAFSARQAALASLTRSLAMELAPGTLVNALAVGAVAGNSRMVSHAPLKRAGSPEEIARAALFLADPANSYTTGHVMAVDGGWSIGYARDF